MKRIKTNKKIIITLLLLLTIIYIGYKHLISFDNICKFQASVTIDHNNHPTITKDGTHIAYKNGTLDGISIFTAPEYSEKQISVSGRLEAIGYDTFNNLYYVVSYSQEDRIDTHTTYIRDYVHIYKNNDIIATMLEPTNPTTYNKYFIDYYSLPGVFKSKNFGYISSNLERMERFYHRSYIIVGKLKIKITGIEKPTIQLQTYADDIKKYTAVINDRLYTCDFNKLDWVSRMIRSNKLIK